MSGHAMCHKRSHVGLVAGGAHGSASEELMCEQRSHSTVPVAREALRGLWSSCKLRSGAEASDPELGSSRPTKEGG